jgi:HEAT repeat protein
MTLLSDSDLPVRAGAAQALGDLGENQAVGELERLAATGAGQLKVAAIVALGKFGSTAVLGPLRRALADTDPGIRIAAAQALGSIHGEEVIPLLQEVYTNRDEVVSVRAQAAVSAARLGDPRAVVQLNTDAQHEDYYVRVWAAWGLGEVGTRAQLFTLVNLLIDQDEMVRPVSAGALLKLSNRLEEEAGPTSSSS